MNIRRSAFFLLGTLLLLTSLSSQRLSAAPSAEMLVRLHWLGLNKISSDTNATPFMKVWQLPQTTALLEQTLDKLSRWPSDGATNAVSARLRPLLDDLIASEFYLEVSAVTNSQLSALNSQLLLAIRLPADRAGLWQTNLSAALEALQGIRPVQTGNGWSLSRAHAPERIDLARIGAWTLLGLGQGTNLSKSEFAARLLQAKSPNTNWLEADLDLPRLCSFLSAHPAKGEGRDVLGSLSLSSIFHVPSSLSQCHLSVCAESNNVLSRVTLNFNSALNLPLSAWDIPTNLFHGCLTSFTAMRGLSSRLAALPVWQKLKLNPAPNQACTWSSSGIPLQTYLAAPLPAASNQLAQLAPRMVQYANPWLATNSEGNFSWSASLPGIVWSEANLLTPFLAAIKIDHQDYLLVGLCPPAANEPALPPAFILDSIRQQPNLLYCDFEQTGSRVEDGLFIGQLFRMVFHRSQMPSNAAGTRWLKNIEPLLGDSATVMIQTGAEQITFARTSTFGFTALELHLLADWLESPQFPHGLHTSLAPPANNIHW